MPYIKQEDRDIIDPSIDEIIEYLNEYTERLYWCSSIEEICDSHTQGQLDIRNHRFDKIYDFADCAGKLNYCLTRLTWHHLKDARYNDYCMVISGLEYLKQKYLDLATSTSQGRAMEVIGVLSNIIHETYIRKVTPYEDLKIKENGDV